MFYLLLTYKKSCNTVVDTYLVQFLSLCMMHPSLTDTFFKGITTLKTIICGTARILQRIQKCHSQVHPQRAKKSSPNTFISAHVAEGNFFVYLFCRALQSYQIIQLLHKKYVILAFFKIIWLFTFFGCLVTSMALCGGFPPSFHWILCSLPIILIGDT